MRRFAGSCRFVFNKALAMQKENHEAGNKFIGYVAMAKHLTGWRNGPDTPWLNEAPCHPLQHALKDLEKAYKNFFAKRADFPRFRRKGSGDSFRYPNPKLNTTPVRRALAAATYRRTIGRLRRNFCASSAATKITRCRRCDQYSRAGYRLLACGESVQSGRSMKQEPTEATTQIAA